MQSCINDYIIDLISIFNKGEVLIWKDYRGEIGPSKAKRFMSLIAEQEDIESKPILQEDGVTYISTTHNDLICTLS